MNTLCYGDNLGYLREMDRESVDLVYLDPPFNSQADYNLLFHNPQGGAVQAQTTAFRDTWLWDMPAEAAFADAVASGSSAGRILRALRGFLGESNLMAYLAMMSPRLIELHRILRPTGTLYLHCDTGASHYLKILLDGIFDAENFRNEISWRRSNPKSHGSTNFPNCRDIILRYSKGQKAIFNKVFGEHDPAYVAKAYKYRDEGGRAYRLLPLLNPNDNRPNLTYEFLGVRRVWRWTRDRMEKAYAEGLVVQLKPGAVPQYKKHLDDSEGRTITNDWNDIKPVHGREAIGYPTQKPVALLERIILASSNEDDVVLDPFCGCGTTIEAAELTNRHWIGIDITHHAIDVIEGRLRRRNPNAAYQVKGRPADPASARRLAECDPYEFQWWSNWRLGVQNYRERKKGADRGIDGIIYFHNPPHGVGQVIVSVKAGHNLNPGMISELGGTTKREDAQMGVLVCAAEPTAGMRRNAAAMGLVRIGKEQYPRIQVATAEQLLNGPLPVLPRPIESDAFRQSLRPPVPVRVAAPQPQLSFALPIPGARGRVRDVQDHLAGALIAELAASR